MHQVTTSSSVVSDDDMHKLPASRDERADGAHGTDSLLDTQCARPSAVRVTRGPRSFTLLSIFPIVSVAETEAAEWSRWRSLARRGGQLSLHRTPSPPLVAAAQRGVWTPPPPLGAAAQRGVWDPPPSCSSLEGGLAKVPNAGAEGVLRVLMGQRQCFVSYGFELLDLRGFRGHFRRFEEFFEGSFGGVERVQGMHHL